MIVCDYCGDPITDRNDNQPITAGTTRLDLHRACVATWAAEASKIKKPSR